MFWRSLLGLAGVLAAGSSPARAADSFCVTCSAPQASYVCEVTLPVGVVPSQSPQLYCAYRLASEGGHASCSSRRAGETPCDGDYRQLAYQGPSLVGPTPDSQVPGESLVPAEAAPDPAATDEGFADPAANEDMNPEPKTVVELTEQVVEQAGNGLEAAGRTTKDLARVTDEAVEDAGETVVQTTQSTSEKISSAAKTALNCLASWFKECE